MKKYFEFFKEQKEQLKKNLLMTKGKNSDNKEINDVDSDEESNQDCERYGLQPFRSDHLK